MEDVQGVSAICVIANDARDFHQFRILSSKYGFCRGIGFVSYGRGFKQFRCKSYNRNVGLAIIIAQ
eukprot:scaffold9714_cov49-Attheya_sp.AAC.3